jgi:hypothetical protein
LTQLKLVTSETTLEELRQEKSRVIGYHQGWKNGLIFGLLVGAVFGVEIMFFLHK